MDPKNCTCACDQHGSKCSAKPPTGCAIISGNGELHGIAVLFAGEIIPQALCKSYALLIGNYCAGMVRVLCYAVGIISWPVSKVLDYVLGNEHTVSLLHGCAGSLLHYAACALSLYCRSAPFMLLCCMLVLLTQKGSAQV